MRMRSVREWVGVGSWMPFGLRRLCNLLYRAHVSDGLVALSVGLVV